MISDLAVAAPILASTPSLPSSGSSPASIRDAARQFESLLIEELLKLSHDADSSGWLGTDNDDSGQTGLEFGEEQLSRMIAQSGGLGLSGMIETGLRRAAAKSTPDAES